MKRKTMKRKEEKKKWNRRVLPVLTRAPARLCYFSPMRMTSRPRAIEARSGWRFFSFLDRIFLRVALPLPLSYRTRGIVFISVEIRACDNKSPLQGLITPLLQPKRHRGLKRVDIRFVFDDLSKKPLRAPLPVGQGFIGVRRARGILRWKKTYHPLSKYPTKDSRGTHEICHWRSQLVMFL